MTPLIDDDIKVESVAQTFKLPSGNIQVLHDINLAVKPKSFTIIYGPSGSGKTTLLNILSGLQAPSSGVVSIAGQKVYDLSSDNRAYFRSQTLGMVYQVNYWVKSLTVKENVALPLYVSGHDMNEANQKAVETLKQIGMDKFANYKPTVLSGGQQQRVSMARALVASPQIILADEPTGNLDSASGYMVMELLKSIQKDMGRTIVLITHNLEYLSYSDHNVHLIDGRIVGSDAKQAKAEEPEHVKSI